MDEPPTNAAYSPGTPEVGRRSGKGGNPPEIRDRIPGFHTDFTQSDRSGPHTLRYAGQPTNAQMPMKLQKAAHSAGFPADPPSCLDCGVWILFPGPVSVRIPDDLVGMLDPGDHWKRRVHVSPFRVGPDCSAGAAGFPLETKTAARRGQVRPGNRAADDDGLRSLLRRHDQAHEPLSLTGWQGVAE